MKTVFVVSIIEKTAKRTIEALKFIKEHNLYDFDGDECIITLPKNLGETEIAKEAHGICEGMFMSVSDYVAYDNSPKDDVDALNHVWKRIVQYIYDVRKDVDGFFFFMDSCVPIKKEWWKILKKEFEDSRMPVLGCNFQIKDANGRPLRIALNPCSFYNKNIPAFIRSVFGAPRIPFYSVAGHEFVSKSKVSDAMVDLHNDGDVIICSKTALIVGDKERKYADLIKKKEDFITPDEDIVSDTTITIKEAVAILNREWEANSASVKKELRATGLFDKLFGADIESVSLTPKNKCKVACKVDDNVEIFNKSEKAINQSNCESKQKDQESALPS